MNWAGCMWVFYPIELSMINKYKVLPGYFMFPYSFSCLHQMKNTYIHIKVSGILKFEKSSIVKTSLSYGLYLNYCRISHVKLEKLSKLSGLGRGPLHKLRQQDFPDFYPPYHILFSNLSAYWYLYLEPLCLTSFIPS